MFNFIKNKLAKIYQQVSSKLGTLFSRNQFDSETQAELESILIGADMGVKTARSVIAALQKELPSDANGDQLRAALERQLKNLITTKYQPASDIYLLVGVNGTGKTTCAAKLAYKLKNDGKKVLFVAADTFRAAATGQLEEWAKRLECPIITGNPGQDPASVVYAGIKEYKDGQYDAVIIDTAGRLQTKSNLMKELEKIKNVIAKHTDEPITTLLTVDTMLGQNSLEQAQLFNESTTLDGIILTKMDGTGKGGIVFAIEQELKVPVAYISYGEKPNELKSFDPDEYINQLLNT